MKRPNFQLPRGFTLIEPQQVFLSFRRLLIQPFRKSGKQRGYQGFTLIELLVTITIIGLLTSIGVFSYQSTNRKARDGKRIADLEQIRTALEIYRSDNRQYPVDWNDLVPDYIQRLPEDPKEAEFGYEYVPDPLNPTDPRTYELCVHLEQVDDPDNDLYCGPGNNCGGTSGGKACNYRAMNP